MIKYLTKGSKQSVGVLLEEMFELHIPTLLSYKDQLSKKEQEDGPEMADMVAETSSLLETLTLPKVTTVLKSRKITSVLDVGCGYGGYLKRLAGKFPKIQFDGIEVDQDVCKRALKTIILLMSKLLKVTFTR
ncbi:class I SAM-dependent methyltransferase [Bacillus sp. JCM 19041]|uniref:class I SAM-dependent methyltransferase n=1 Tax=Bacillus sp. JCM 19041 TaxID=1460637 RepID=UPI0006CFCE5C